MNTAAVGATEQRFAVRMKAVRHALGMSAQGLSDNLEAAGVPSSRIVISKIECHDRRITLDEAAGICRALGVSMDAMTSPEPMHYEVLV